ncbi:MAG TPA: rod shape-determining protein MreD [Oligoflexia bacterium]|nr:rod shape-determining protein MreD [Oligoflexia bacterium]HMP48666.1 rod shape-determining protein MreD [Oligoflexia bacterium]
MLKKILKLSLLLAIGVILQGSVFPKFLPFLSPPDLLLILVLWVALSSPDIISVYTCFALGLAGDFFSGLYLGPQALGALIACVLVKGISRHIYADQFLSLALVALIASLFKQFSGRILLFVFIGFSDPSEFSLSLIIFQSLSTSLIGALILRYALSKKTGHGRSKKGLLRI